MDSLLSFQKDTQYTNTFKRRAKRKNAIIRSLNYYSKPNEIREINERTRYVFLPNILDFQKKVQLVKTHNKIS